jgi:hypothetical protein
LKANIKEVNSVIYAALIIKTPTVPVEQIGALLAPCMAQAKRLLKAWISGGKTDEKRYTFIGAPEPSISEGHFVLPGAFPANVRAAEMPWSAIEDDLNPVKARFQVHSVDSRFSVTAAAKKHIDHTTLRLHAEDHVVGASAVRLAMVAAALGGIKALYVQSALSPIRVVGVKGNGWLMPMRLD